MLTTTLFRRPAWCLRSLRRLLSHVATLATLAVLVLGERNVMAVTPIQAGDLVVYRVAGGTSVATGNPATLANTGNAVVIDDYRLVSGTYTLSQSIVMPTTTSVVNGVTQYSLIDSGTAGSDGLLTVSEDGRYIALTGYSRPLGGTGSITGTAAATNPRTIGILTTATGAVDTSTALTNAADANNARSAVTSNGTDIWFAGGASGINYTTKGSTTGVSLNASVPTGNFRQVNIVNGQLYASTGSTVTNRAVNTIGTGLPTGAGQAVTILPGLPTAGATAQSPYGFFFADLNPSIAGNDVLYVADDGSSTSTGLSKYLFDGTNWLAAGHVGVSADSYRGLTGTVSNGIVSLFSTRKGGSGATGGGELVSITDNTGYNDGQGTNHTANDFTSLAPTVLITAATNSAFRGVVYIPAAPAARNLTWRGTQTSWNAATGWLNGATPVTFDSVTPDNGVFDATGVSQSTVTLSSATTLGTLTFSTSGYTIQSNTLTIKGVNGSGISATGGSATINSAIVLGGDQAWSVGTNRTLTVNNLSGTAALSKNGAGLLVIGGAATHTNGTNVNGGEVRVNGSLAGNVIVNSSATLSGSGTISGTTVVNSGGTVSPGVSVGAITFSNGIDFQSGGTLNWNLNALSTANPGTNFSILNVTGGNFNAGGSSGLKLGFTGTSADPDTSNSAFWNAAHTWKIVDFSGAGTSTGVFSKLSNGSYQKGVFTQSITGDPNDVYVNFTPTNVAAAQTLIWNGVNASIAAGDNAGVWNAVDNNFVSGMTAAVFNPFSKDNVTFGSGTGGGSTTTVSVGGPLKVGNITFATGPNYILSGGSIGLNGNITVNTSATITSDIALQSASNWSVDAGQSLAVSGTLSGLANLTKSGPGQLTLTATGLSKNTYNGKITIQDGQLLINDELGARAALRGSPINLTSSTAEVFGSNNASATITEFRIGEVSGSGKVTSKFGAISQTLLINAQADATFSGILDVGDGTQELRIRGTGTQTLSGLTATQSPKTLHIYHGAGFTLAGTAEFNNGINGNNVQIDGGTLTLDNSTTNDPDRLAAVVSTISGRGRLNYIGNSAGSTEGLGTLAVSNNGAMHVAVTHTAGTTANTDVTFAIVTHSGSGTLNFENTGGVLGATGNNPHIFITSGVPDVSTATTTTNLALVNGIIGRKGAVGGPNPVGYAFVNGTDYATYDATLGVQAYNAYHVGLTGAVATDNVSITTTDTVAATQAINSLKLAPTTAGQTLTVASGAALNTLSVLTTGSADMTITGAGTVLANGSTRQLYVQSGRTLTVNAAISNFQTSAGDSPIAKSGGGTLVLGGTQTFTETLRITEGVVRAQPGVSLAGTVSGSNTTSTATIDIRDAVLEIAGPSTETTTIFALGNVTNTFQFNGSGGFAAFGGPRKVDLGGQIGWEAPNMVGAGNALVFGSATATDRIELVNSINLNPVNFDDTYNLREFRVDKNVTPNSGDFARLSGNISGSVYNDIFKTGNGSLELTADNRTSGGGFNGGINVAQGTLLAGATGALGNAMYTIVGGRGGSSDAALLTSAAITIDKDIHVQSGSSGTASLGGNAAVNSTFSGAINLNRNVQVTQVAGGKTTSRA